MAGLMCFTDSTVETPPESDTKLRADFRAVQLLTFTVISRCCSPALQPDEAVVGGAGHAESLNEDSLTSVILRDEAMQEAEQSTKLLPQVNYVDPTKQDGRPGQRGQLGGDGSGGGKSAKDAEEKKSARDSDGTKGGRGRSAGRRLCRESKPRKENQSTKSSTSTKDADSSSGSKGRGDKEASCSLVGIVESTLLLAPEAGEDFQAVAATVQVSPAVVLLDSGCSHNLTGTKEAFVDLEPSGDVKHVRGFNGALQDVQGRGTVALQGEAGRQVLILDVLYVPGVHANLLSAGQLKESGVKLQDEGDRMLLVLVARDVLGRATYTGQVLCTDLRPCTPTSTLTTIETVALRTIAMATKSTAARWHVRLAHVGVNTIMSSAKHEVATGLDIKSSPGTDSLCVSCVGGKLARHTFPDKGSDADDALGVVHINLCGPCRVAAKDGSMYFLLLKDRKTRYVWVRPVAKNSDVLREFEKWLVVEERQTKKSVLMLRSDQGGEFLGRQARDADGGGVGADDAAAHGCAAPLMAPRSAPGRLGEELLGEVDAAAGDNAAPAADRQEARLDAGPHVGLHGAVPHPRVAARWEAEAEGQVNLPTDTLTATLPLLAEVGELANEDADDVRPPPPSPAPPAPPTPPLVTDLRELTSTSASGDEESSGASPVVPAKNIAGGRCDIKQVGVGANSTLTGEQQPEEVQPTWVKSAKKALAEKLPTGEQPAAKSAKELSTTEQSAGEPTTGEQLAGTTTLVDQPGLWCSGRIQRPPEWLTYHDCLSLATYTTVYDDANDDMLYDDAEDDVDLPELDPDIHADPEHCWDITTMTVKEALASWKGKAVKAAMDKEIHSLIDMGT
ncbi:unnamed protein product [Closterium sp. NIES-54]